MFYPGCFYEHQHEQFQNQNMVIAQPNQFASQQYVIGYDPSCPNSVAPMNSWYTQGTQPNAVQTYGATELGGYDLIQSQPYFNDVLLLYERNYARQFAIEMTRETRFSRNLNALSDFFDARTKNFCDIFEKFH